jgi:hypothetical protein
LLGDRPQQMWYIAQQGTVTPVDTLRAWTQSKRWPGGHAVSGVW